MPKKLSLYGLGLALVMITANFGCSKTQPSAPATPQDEAAATTQAAAAAQKGMARDQALQQSQQADAARRGTQ